MLPILALVALAPLPKMELVVVMNIDLGSEAIFKSHFEVASGWASFVRVSSAIDQQGWKPDIERLTFLRSRRLAIECRQRGWGMHVHLGGTPHPAEWSKALGAPPKPYRPNRYASMPRSWWPQWVEFQRAAAKATVEAYGPNATQKIRFQLMNEPYGRGEDEVVDELIKYMVPRLVDSKGLLFGCPVDGPSIFGYPDDMNAQIRRFAALLKSDPILNRTIQRVPYSAYPLSTGDRNLDPEKVVEGFVTYCEKIRREGEATFGRPIYFCEFGIGRAYDMPVSVFGARANQLADWALIETLDRLRRRGMTHATIYQTRDDNAEDERIKGYGLLDRFGRLRVDKSNFVRLIRGEPVVFKNKPAGN